MREMIDILSLSSYSQGEKFFCPCFSLITKASSQEMFLFCVYIPDFIKNVRQLICHPLCIRHLQPKVAPCESMQTTEGVIG